MVGSRHAGLAFLLLTALAPQQASAFGARGAGASASPLRSYPAYDPYCVIVPARSYAPSILPVPTQQVPMAVPTPAPPSQTNEPPLSPRPIPPTKALSPTKGETRGPAIVESRSQIGSTANAGPFRVGFWNLTGKDVALTIDGKVQTLPRDRAVTVELNRQFVWQIDQRSPQNERVPDDQSGYEVVIRP